VKPTYKYPTESANEEIENDELIVDAFYSDGLNVGERFRFEELIQARSNLN